MTKIHCISAWNGQKNRMENRILKPKSKTIIVPTPSTQQVASDICVLTISFILYMVLYIYRGLLKPSPCQLLKHSQSKVCHCTYLYACLYFCGQLTQLIEYTPRGVKPKSNKVPPGTSPFSTIPITLGPPAFYFTD